jgi:hypothetical protein
VVMSCHRDPDFLTSDRARTEIDRCSSGPVANGLSRAKPVAACVAGLFGGKACELTLSELLN